MKDHVTNRYEKPSVAFDFDGTLNIDSHEDIPGPAHLAMRDLIDRLWQGGWWIVVVSARPPTHYPIVEGWLKEWEFRFDQIALGSKPSVDVFIDDKGLLPPMEALHEFIERRRQPDPLRTLARGESPTDFAKDIADTHENPSWTGRHSDPDFRVVVPLSGGMDSLTCFAMSSWAGYPTVPVYVDTGADYAHREVDVCEGLVDNLKVIDAQQEFVRYDYIDLGRNPIILWSIVNAMRAAGWWGEVPFGNTVDVTETPVRGGDKSLRFFGTMQALLTMEGHDVRITNPVAGMTKADIVAWWIARDALDTVRQARSCYADIDGHCGRCRCCFKRWLAFEWHDANTEAMWPHGTDFRVWVKEYEESLVWDSPTMAPARRAHIDAILGVTAP